jgi:molybdopterin/thiamine biosynthesis adenylyltransferase
VKRLVFPADHAERLTADLDLGGGIEAAAVAFTRAVAGNAGERLLVNEVRIAQPADYLERSPVHVLMRGNWVLDALVHAQRTGMGAVFIHSHPHQDVPTFSGQDDEIETRLARLFHERARELRHLALVVGKNGASCRVLGGSEPVQVWSVNSRLQRLDREPAGTGHVWAGSTFDRQIRALGDVGQSMLASLRIAIVGLGGTGSLIAQQLAYLGCRDFVLIDPQALEDTNLNRVVGAYPGDEGKAKVEIAARMIRSIRPEATIQPLRKDVCDRQTAERLREVDIILSCTDSQGSRAVINRIAYQYLIPAIDMGTQIRIRDSDTGLYGRVQLLAPGLPCLHCHNALDSTAVRLDLMSPEARAKDPYGMPPEVKQPAVISINWLAASLAVTMLLQTVTPLAGNARSLRYEGVEARVKAISVILQQRCPDCAERFWGQGDAVPLLARPEPVAQRETA